MKKFSPGRLTFALALCFITKLSLAQQWGPDPGNTYGPGTTTRTTTSTNSETMIPETKTEYKDANGTTRKETIKTKDQEGNDVTKEKIYDKTGTLIEEDEIKKDPKSGKIVYSETKKYGYAGKVIEASKFLQTDGKYYFFDYDYKNQKYKDPRIVSSVKESKNGFFVCNASKFNLNVGYSYLQTNTGDTKSLPMGIDLGIGYRVSNKFRLFFDFSGHSSKKDDQTLQRIFALPGVEYSPRKDDENKTISIFSRIAIGMMHERFKTKQQDASGTSAFSCGAGAGVDVRVGCRTAIRLSGDYLASFVNDDILHGVRLGAGLNIDLDDRFARPKN